MKTADCLLKHRAHTEYTKWALSISDDMADVWDALIEQGKYEWLVWTATRPGVFSASAIHKLLCRFVRETPLSDGRKVWDLLTNERSRKAIEVVEAYADGKATGDELKAARDAAYDATRAAAYAARVAAYSAAAAAYTNTWATYHYSYAASAAVHAERAARATAWAAGAGADEAAAAAESAQIKMIAELGNPFK